jgi:hypothetical protein
MGYRRSSPHLQPEPRARCCHRQPIMRRDRRTGNSGNAAAPGAVRPVNIGTISIHSAKLPDEEHLIAVADARLMEVHRSGTVELDQNGDDTERHE